MKAILIVMSLCVLRQWTNMATNYITKLKLAQCLKYLMNIVLTMIAIFPSVIARRYINILVYPLTAVMNA